MKNYTITFSLFVCFLMMTVTVFSYNNTPDTIPTPKIITNIKTGIKNILTKKTKDSIHASVIKKDSITKVEKPNYWTIKNKPSILFTQTSFVNWVKGGNNTTAGIAAFSGNYNYKKGQLFWNNSALIKYGLSKEDEFNYALKTDDIIQLKSALGYKPNDTSKWYYSGDFSLTTQMAKGYNNNTKTTVISTFFAPARMRIGLGAAYTNKKENITLNISPLTNQVTFVLDQDLANSGAFGVTAAETDGNGNIIKKGENIYSEFGALISAEYKTLIMKNVNLSIKSSFYSDYLNKFGNVDTDIEMNIDMKVNKYIQSTITSHLLYDDDARILQDDGTQIGPKAQLKQILGIGVSYLF